MDYRVLGKTGLKVSAVALGTVELGVDYGIRERGQSNLVSRKEALDLIHHAADRGINFFDTAPAYGLSEEVLGEALGRREDCHIATKVSIPPFMDRTGKRSDVVRSINESIEKSLRRLRRDELDVVQIHNATAEVIETDEVGQALTQARKAGKVRFLGASVYGEEAAAAVVGSKQYDILQIAFSILDQRMATNVLPLAREAGVGIMVRSALLKGALTSRAKWLPDELYELREASEKVVRHLGLSWDTLPQVALRFCLSAESIGTVLIGASNGDELDYAIDAAELGLLDMRTTTMAKKFAISDERLLNPSCWPVP
jgi:aryl-alcohol dehydrogenase-like predicted oxidoreductase